MSARIHHTTQFVKSDGEGTIRGHSRTFSLNLQTITRLKRAYSRSRSSTSRRSGLDNLGVSALTRNHEARIAVPVPSVHHIRGVAEGTRGQSRSGVG